MRCLRILACALALGGFAAPTAGAERVGDAIVLRVPALPDAARHLKLLEYPSFLALALENNGFSPSLSSRLAIKDRTEFEIRSASVRFAGRKGQVYRYEAVVKLPMGGSAAVLRVPVEVDTSALESGSLVVRVYAPLSSLLPADLLERIEFKLRALASDPAQRQMVRYLDEVAGRQKPGGGIDPVLEAILVEAYNRGTPTASTGRDVGDAEPLAEQYALIATLAIWLIIVPLLILGWTRHSRRRGKRTPAA